MFAVLCVLSLVTMTLADLQLLLLHTNDMHARFQQADRYLGMCDSDTSKACYGGFARVKAVAEKYKKDALAAGRQTIFINAGDNFQGTPYFTFFKWPIVSQLVSMIGFDVMTLGNHEFDDGPVSLAAYLKNVTVRNICCNLNLDSEPVLKVPNLMPSVVLTVDKVKIGVIGYLTPDVKFLSNTGNLQVYDEIPSIRKEAQRLKKEENVNILIATGHSGYLRDQVIAKEVEEIDVVVGAHSHTFLYSGTPPDPVDVPTGPYPTVITQASGKKVPVVQAFYGTKYLGHLELNFDDKFNLKSWNGQPILLSGDLPQDPGILAALQPYERDLHDKISAIVGYTGVLIDNGKYSCRLGECNMGNLLTDAYVDYATRNYTTVQGWTVAAIAVEQAGGMRASIDTQISANHNGSITLGDVITVQPWGNKVVVKNLNGSTLMAMLEYSVHRFEITINGHVNEFLQVSGIKVVYDMAKESGKRVVSVEVRCADCNIPKYQPLNMSATYGVAMPEYLGTGGDGFAMLIDIPNSYIFGDVDYMVLANYIQTHSPVYPAVEGRITVLNPPSSSTTIAISWALLVPAVLLAIQRLPGTLC